MNPLLQLKQEGLSFWLDVLARAMIRGGEITRRIETAGLSGITSNPAIFHKAISGSHHYDDLIEDVVRRDLPVERIYRELIVGDARDACDLLRPVFKDTGGAGGSVSLEVSPHLAYDTDGTIRQAQELW
jgi:transaldolase